MLLYTESQLELSYNIYRMHQIGQGLGFMELENFRRLYEELEEEDIYILMLKIQKIGYFKWEIQVRLLTALICILKHV